MMIRKILVLCLPVVIVVSLASLAPTQSATNSTITVTNLNDSGPGSLRQAIIDANAAGGGTVNFKKNVKGTIDLLTALPDLNANITINGPGADKLTVERSFAIGTPDFSIFAISRCGTVTISGLTIKNGNAPGLNIGGGILNSGTLTIDNSTLSGNSSDYNGGGIYNQGTLTLSDSTLSGNTASRLGGAIVSSGTLTVTGVTVANNTAPQGGGIANPLGLTVNLQSTIVAKNTGGPAPDVSGLITSLGHNFIGDTTGVTGYDPSRGDLINVDPLFRLDASGKPLLADNGGPTQTIALLPGSPAIDSGLTNFLLDTDQRGPGFARRVDIPTVNNGGGNGTDIGAYEVQILQITRVAKSSKNLLVSGTGFVEGAKILIDGEPKKTIYESATSLRGKKAAKGLAPGAKIKVRNPDGSESNEVIFQ